MRRKKRRREKEEEKGQNKKKIDYDSYCHITYITFFSIGIRMANPMINQIERNIAKDEWTKDRKQIYKPKQ